MTKAIAGRPFDLNLRHLRAIGAIVARGSVSAAAEAVSLSQPALTQGIAKLERQLSTRLFVRGPAGMRPTEAGTVFAARGAAALAHLAGAARRGSGRGFARPELLMTASQLGAFLALADAGSFTAASAATGLSQPALHRAVRDLERLVAVPIAERRGRGVALTEAGRRLARGIRLAAAELSAAIAEAAPAAGGGGRIGIGAMPFCRARLLPPVLAHFAAEHPEIAAHVVEGSWRELVQPLLDGQIDLMIGALRPDAPPDLAHVPLCHDRLAVIARAGHPLAGAPRTAAELARYPWIVGMPGSPLRLHWEAMFGDHPPPAPIECGSVAVMRGVLRASDQLTLLSSDQVALELETGVLIAIETVTPGATRAIGVTMRAGWRPTRAQARFVDLLGRQALQLSE